MPDLNRERNVRTILPIGGDGQAFFGLMDLGGLRAQLHEVKEGGAGSRAAVREHFQSANLLEHFHEHDFFCHISFSCADYRRTCAMRFKPGKCAWHGPVDLIDCAGPMTNFRKFLLLVVVPFLVPLAAAAQQELPLHVEKASADSWLEMDREGIVTVTNGVIVTYGGAILVAERVTANLRTYNVEAFGRVRIQRDEQIWAGEHIQYNFKTREIVADQFRTGKTPVFAEGVNLHSERSNTVYSGTGALVTTDDNSEPATKLRASSITVYPGQRIVARNATLYLGGMPVFYFPYFSQRLDKYAGQFTFLSGSSSRSGFFLLTKYSWYVNDFLDAALRLDYRTKRGVAGGPDLNLHLGRWGEVDVKYYYMHDNAPETDANGLVIPENRQRVAFGYDATPWTNLNVKASVQYQSDPLLRHDFFESDYRHNPQPRTFAEVNQLWDNFSLDVFAQPRVNDFFETVESLPEVRLTGFRQQLGASPVYYESESSAGYYRRRFAESNSIPTGLDFEAARADTYHQFVLPQTYFGWLNFTPRVGGRFTYYSRASGPGAMTAEDYRGVFNTGAEVSFKASRVWPGLENKFLDLSGLRHIVQPSVNYVYVPKPSVEPSRLPPFTYESPSLRLLPIEYPDYNAIDSVDSQNVIRFGLANKLQTKREGQVEDVLRWDLYTDWRLQPRTNQTTFADLWSDLLFRPRSWLALESQLRYDVDRGILKMAFHNLTLTPNDRWSWSLGHWYLRDDLSGPPLGLGTGNNLISSSIFYRLNENWGLRATQFYEARESRLQEQFYTVYHDFRSWTGALTFRARNNNTGREDYTVAFTFSLKAKPRYKVGADAVQPYQLIGN